MAIKQVVASVATISAAIAAFLYICSLMAFYIESKTNAASGSISSFFVHIATICAAIMLALLGIWIVLP